MVALIKEHEAIPETALRLVELVLPEDGRQPRRDALPEHTNYHDSGCDLHPSCLHCPLVRCRYDEPGGARQVMSRDRDNEVLTLQRRGGRSIEQIARQVGVSRRTVFRILARARSEGGCS
ncbi:MAG: helix-turn-helix domain-containing protein [Dehalococcoidia bacterium]